MVPTALLTLIPIVEKLVSRLPTAPVKLFSYDRVFTCASKQIELYKTVVLPILEEVTTVQSLYRKVKPVWILLKQETVSGSGISWSIYKSAPRFRQITTPAPTTQFLQAGCPSCCPTNSVKALKVTKFLMCA